MREEREEQDRIKACGENTSPQAFFRALGRMRFMSTVVIEAGHLAGTVSVPPSKSAAHRFLIAAALAGGGQVENPGDSQDLQATRSCLNRLTAREAGLPLLELRPDAVTLEDVFLKLTADDAPEGRDTEGPALDSGDGGEAGAGQEQAPDPQQPAGDEPAPAEYGKEEESQ